MLQPEMQERLWQSNYRSMTSPQLVAELARIARHPQLYDNRVERKASIASELATRVRAPEVPIIVLEAD